MTLKSQVSLSDRNIEKLWELMDSDDLNDSDSTSPFVDDSAAGPDYVWLDNEEKDDDKKVSSDDEDTNLVGLGGTIKSSTLSIMMKCFVGKEPRYLK